MENIYIGLSTRKGFALGSELIKWGEGTRFSHVYVRRKSKRVGEYVYQATFSSGVNFMGIDIFLTKNKIIEEYEFEVSNDHMIKIIRFFIKNAGRDYSFKQIGILSKIMLLEKLGIKCNFSKMVDGKEKFICSELGAIILEDFKSGQQLPSDLDLITPNKLKPYLQKYCSRRIK